MPEISRFFGIIIRMYFDDHGVAHFHALYAETEARIGIDPIQLLEGDLPRRAVSLVLEWCALHQHELMSNWRLLREEQHPRKIAPLE